MARPFHTATQDLWANLDGSHNTEWQETDKEADEFDRETRDDIKGRLAAPSGVEHGPSIQLDWHDVGPSTSLPERVAEETTATASRPDLGTSKVLKTPWKSGPTGTMPSVPTPANVTPQLPAPPPRASIRKARRTIELDTPAHVASPIDTPGPSSRAPQNTLAGQNSLGTPLPIGSTPFASLRQKKEYQTLTKLFEDFNKDVAKADSKLENPVKKASGRCRTVSKADSMALGANAFKGLRFCIPPELGPASKHDRRWRIIASLGGQVTLQPDTAITHVIHDKASASIVCNQLGISTLSELPQGTLCVKWEYVASCKIAGKLLDPKTWLSFPETTLTRKNTSKTTTGSSRLTDISDQLKARTMSINRKRPETASDSETESSKRPYRGSGLRAASALLPSRDKAYTSSRDLSNTKTGAATSTATTHRLPSGLGWQQASKRQADGLDDMISGVQNGTAPVEELTDDEASESETRAPPPPKDDSNPDRRGDAWKCGQAHDGKSNKGPNEWLAIKFCEMHTMYAGMRHKNEFSIRQYQQAASILRRTSEPITSGAQAMKIKGIGKSIADRIDEFITGAKGRQFYENNEEVQTIAQFKMIYGAGRDLAARLYNLGARSIDDLRKHDYGLTVNQQIGVDLYEDLNSRIPRSECRQIFEVIREETEKIDKKIWIEIMGSYRRGQEDSGDVDILITRNPHDGLTHAKVLSQLWKVLWRRGFITHDLMVPTDWDALEAKWMGICRLGPNTKYRRLDILCIPFEQWGAALIYFTGNDIFNRSIRLYARKKGMSLNQRGLYANVTRGKDGQKETEGEIIASRTEQEIFDVLGLRWRHPHHRRP